MKTLIQLLMFLTIVTALGACSPTTPPSSSEGQSSAPKDDATKDILWKMNSRARPAFNGEPQTTPAEKK